MDSFFSFSKSPVKAGTPLPSLNETEQRWHKAKQQYQDKQYKESLLSVIDYCNDSMRKAYGNQSQSEFNFPHGSVIVQLKITDQELIVTVPFLQLPDENPVPLMRRVAEANQASFTLSKVVKRNNDLSIEYKEKLELCEPDKMYDVLRNICVNADYYDDEFTSLFNAKRIREAQTTPYDTELANKSWDLYQHVLNETESYIKYYDSKRMTAFTWDSLIICFYRLDYYLKPQGSLSNTIRKAVSDLRNQYMSYPDRVILAKKTFAEAKTITKEAFTADLYYIQEFIPWKNHGRLEKIQNHMEAPYETALFEFNDNQYMASALTVFQNYCSLLYYYNLSEEVETFIVESLGHASGKSWKEAAEILIKSLENLVEGDLLVGFANTEMNAAAGFDMNSMMNQAMAQFGKLFGKQ